MSNHYRLYQTCRHDIQNFGSFTLWLMFRCLPAVVAVAIALLLLSAPGVGATEAAPDLSEIQGGELLLQVEDEGGYRTALMQESEVHIEITGMIARVRLSQRFDNESDEYVEGVYAFPLPDEAAVRYMEMRVGERRVVGKIRERREAKKKFEAAKRQGKRASLVEQQRPNLFTNRVANIGSRESITVTLEYIQPVAYDGKTFSLRFPTTLTPRYMPGQASVAESVDRQQELTLELVGSFGWAKPTDQVPDAHLISPKLHARAGSDSAPLNGLRLSVALTAGVPLANVSSRYHDVSLVHMDPTYHVNLKNGVAEMDRDFVLDWQPVRGSAPRAAIFTEEVDGEYFGMVMLVPPTGEAAQTDISREVIFVVDTSGSMGGVSIDQARRSLAHALDLLGPNDRFNIIEFNSRHRMLYRTPMPAAPRHINRAHAFVNQLEAGGGTEMMSALRAALAPTEESDLLNAAPTLKQIVFITDGAVGNETALFKEISSRLGDTRLFTVGIGSAPNSWFMRKAARFGRGSHTHIGDLGEVGERMSQLFDQLSQPALLNLEMEWPAEVEAWPQRVPDLYRGEPLSVVVNFGEEKPAGEVVLKGDIGAKAWSRRLNLSGVQETLLQKEAGEEALEKEKGVASLWARRKIESLLDQLTMGREREAVRDDVLPLALRHQLLSPFTSFVAIEEVVSRPQDKDLRSKGVPNTRPKGQSPQVFAFSSTATTGPAKLWFASLCLFLAMLILVMRQGEPEDRPLVKR
jgi:Ca-activated chloride channel homolog